MTKVQSLQITTNKLVFSIYLVGTGAKSFAAAASNLPLHVYKSECTVWHFMDQTTSWKAQ